MIDYYRTMNDLILLFDIIGGFYILWISASKLLKFEKVSRHVSYLTRVGVVACALGLLSSSVFSVNHIYGDGLLSVWKFPLWGLKDIGIVLFFIGVLFDYRKHSGRCT
jgi:hypothetical protein